MKQYETSSNTNQGMMRRDLWALMRLGMEAEMSEVAIHMDHPMKGGI